MPLRKGSDRATVSYNIHEMENSGRPHDVAVAAALHTANPGQSPKKRKRRRVIP